MAERADAPDDGTPAPDVAVELDVREIAGEPFDPIMDALADLAPGERLLLRAGFEPVPLYDVLASRGFDHETTADGDEYRVLVERSD
jgi:uncharacterized protein (DUF2249 family)